MPMVTVRMSKYEKELLSAMATFYGTTISDLMKHKSLDPLEDKYDALVGEKNYMDYKQHGGKLYTTQDIEKELRPKK